MAKRPRKPKPKQSEEPKQSKQSKPQFTSADFEGFDKLVNEDPDLEPIQDADSTAPLPTSTDDLSAPSPFSPAQSSSIPEDDLAHDEYRLNGGTQKVKRILFRRVKEKIIGTIISLFPEEADGRITKGTIVRAIKEQYGVSTRTIERLFGLARERVREMVRTDTIESREDHTWLAHQTYRTVIRDGLAGMRAALGDENDNQNPSNRYSGMVGVKELLTAQAADIQLLGLAKPQTISITDRDGKVAEPLIQIRQAMLFDPQLRDLAAEMTERMAGLNLTKRAPLPVNGFQEVPGDSNDSNNQSQPRPLNQESVISNVPPQTSNGSQQDHYPYGAPGLYGTNGANGTNPANGANGTNGTSNKPSDGDK